MLELCYEQQYLLDIHIIPDIMTITFASICLIGISKLFPFPSLRIGL